MKTLTDTLQRAWYGGALWYWPLLCLLWPLSLLFIVLAAVRRWHLQRLQGRLPVPVIVVGNISVGGTGKTPLLCALSTMLVQRGLRVGIVSRGYGGSYSGEPRLVLADDSAAVVGDEPLLLALRTACPVMVGRDRFATVQQLVAGHAVDIVLSDDGLQHYALPRTLEIAVLDGSRGVGNGFCLPAGPLREPVSRLAEVDAVVVNGDSGRLFRADQLVVRLLPQDWLDVRTGKILPLLHLPPGSRVHAVAGIGNPQRFFCTLRELGFDVTEHPLPDHHAFSVADLQFADQLPVVMTEKDAVKCADFAPENCYALRVHMLLPDQWVDGLLALANEKFRRS